MPTVKRIRPKVASASSARVARYINTHWKGNCTAAASALGCNYMALWKAANGFTVRPSVEVAQALAKHSEEPLETWLAVT